MIVRDLIEYGSDNSLQFVKEVHWKETLYIGQRIYELGMQFLREARSAVRERFLIDYGFLFGGLRTTGMASNSSEPGSAVQKSGGFYGRGICRSTY